jgi:predicted acyl esterase
MRRPSWAPWPVLIVLAALALGVAVGLVIVTVGGSSTPTKITGVRSDVSRRIPVGGGVELSAEVVTPRGSGSFPLLVLPASWGSTQSEYHGLSGVLARNGYEVVAYTQRGFQQSGGQVDFAAPTTQRDVSTVIDWALAHEPADSKRIGLFGTSYGGGVSLLAAARDARIKAVVATSTWTDFAATFAANHTPSAAALGGLLGSAAKVGHLDGPLATLQGQLTSTTERTTDAIDALSAERSAADVVAGINAHRTAVMIANGFGDSIIPPGQLISFVDKLTGPKRLQLAPGDHGGPEASGLAGGADRTTRAAQEWLDHYVKGVANGADHQPEIQLQDVITGKVHTYAAWPSASRRIAVNAPGDGAGLTTGAARPWTAAIAAGTDTVATSGPSTSLSTAPYQPPRAALTNIDAQHGLVWSGGAFPQPTTMAGTPQLTVDVASSTGAATLFAYLYDVDAGGTGALMSVTPYTVTGARSATRIAFALQPTAWTFAPGHRLALVIDTVDPRWLSAGGPGTTVTLSSTAAAPATLSLPAAS